MWKIVEQFCKHHEKTIEFCQAAFTLLPVIVPGGPTLFDLRINTANISNLTYLDFPGAISGTVTVTSEAFATPLPPALPLVGSGVIALAGFAWRSRGEVSA
jgi:hypothetical protein